MLSRFNAMASTAWSATKSASNSLYSGLQTIGSVTKNYILPSAVSLMRTISVAGSSLLTIPDIVKYLAGSANHALTLPLSIIAATIEAVMTNLVRTPLIFKQFRGDGEDPSSTDETPPIPLSMLPKIIYYALQGISQTGALFITYSNYLSSIVLAEFLAKLAGKEKYEEEEQYAVYIFALFLAVSNWTANQAYNQKKFQKSARQIAEAIEQRQKPTLKVFLAVLLGGLATATQPFLAYLWTLRGLKKFLVMSIEGLPAMMIAGFSALVGGTTSLINISSSILKYLNKKEEQASAPLPCYLTTANIMAYGLGVASKGVAGLAAYISIIKTLEHTGFNDLEWVKNMGLDNEYHPGIVFMAAFFAISNAIALYQFDYAEALPEVSKYYLRKKKATEGMLIKEGECSEEEYDEANELTLSLHEEVRINQSSSFFFNNSSDYQPLSQVDEEEEEFLIKRPALS